MENSAFTADRYEIYEVADADHYWARSRNQILWRHLSLRRASASTPVIDIGCGTGATVDFLRERGVDAFGCDLGTPKPASPHVLPHLYLGRDVFSLPASVLELPTTALLLDVLEHLADPAAFLRDIVTRMPALEDLFITLPARAELWTNFDEFYGHHLRYSMRDASELAAAANLVVTYRTYFFHSLYLPLLAIARLNRRRSLLRPREARPLPRALNRLLTSWMVRDESILPRTLVGSSILVVLRRS